jgi:hypothetical protein
MMKILALERERPGAAAEQFQPYFRAEAFQAWELYQSGIIRELYFQQEEHTAVLVLECSDRKEAQLALARLPLVQAGLIEFDLLPLVPYDGFARLFTSPPSSEKPGLP